MRKHRVPPTFKPNGSKPACKQCKEGRVISAITGKTIPSEPDPTAHVVKFMGAWACSKHFQIQNTKFVDGLTGGASEWPLGELFVNRAQRRAVGHTHGASR